MLPSAPSDRSTPSTAWTDDDRRLSAFIDAAAILLEQAVAGGEDAVTASCRAFLTALEALTPEPADG